MMSKPKLLKKLTVILSRVIKSRELRFLKKKKTGKKQLDKMMSKPKSLKN